MNKNNWTHWNLTHYNKVLILILHSGAIITILILKLNLNNSNLWIVFYQLFQNMSVGKILALNQRGEGLWYKNRFSSET